MDERMEENRLAPGKSASRTLRPVAQRPGAGSLSTSEAAVELGMTERTVRRAIARGDLAAVRRGGGYRIERQELARYAAQAERSDAPGQVARVTVLPAPAHSFAPLPVPLSSFIGRDAELETLIALLSDPVVRLVTLCGPGGVGKTRLSIAAATAVRSRFPDGIVFVALAAVFQPALVIPAIADALGLQEIAGRDRRAQVRSFLRGKRLLLVLDNFEQVLSAAVEVAQLATEAPDVTVLVTSRAPLRVSGERELPLAPMTLPRAAASPDELAMSDASQLFVARAREHDPAFRLDEETAPDVADICARLDGIPLAIELAAARAKVLPPRQLRAHLQQRLPLLTSGSRDAPHRHATMHDAIAWSYDLLSPEEQRLFRRLAVFVGGFTLDAITGTEGGGRRTEVARKSSSSVLDLVASLIDQSLLARDIGADGEPRYRMLETIREYGLSQLEDDEATTVRAAHAHIYLDLAWELRALANTRATRAPLDRLAADDDNVRAAVEWLDAAGEPADFVRMVAACYTFLFARSHFREAENWLERALRKADHAAAADRARLLLGSAELLMVKGRFAQANAAFAETLPLIRTSCAQLDLAMALVSSGAALNYDGRYLEGQAHLRDALALTDDIADATLRAAVAARTLANLSVSARGQGDFAAATAYGEDALRLSHDAALDLAETRILADLGDIAKDQGDYLLAASRYLASLEQTTERGELRSVAEVLSGMAGVAIAWGQQRTALLLQGAAMAIRERIGFGMLPPIDVAARDRDLAALHAALGEREAAAILREGQALSVAEAMAIAADVAPVHTGVAAATAAAASRDALTPRERDVLRLLVESRTDREIAEELFLSPRTVSWHVSTILAKLGAATRREAIALSRSSLP